MDPNIMTGIIAAVASVLTAFGTILAQRKRQRRNGEFWSRRMGVEEQLFAHEAYAEAHKAHVFINHEVIPMLKSEILKPIQNMNNALVEIAASVKNIERFQHEQGRAMDRVEQKIDTKR